MHICRTDLFLLVVRVYTLTPCSCMAQVTKHIVCVSPQNTHTSSRNVVHLATLDDTKHGNSFFSNPEPVLLRAQPLRRSTATAEWRCGWAPTLCRLFSSDDVRKPNAKRRRNIIWKSRRSTFGLGSWWGDPAQNNPTTFFLPHKDYQLQENNRRLQQAGWTFAKQSTDSSKEAKRSEFEAVPNSTFFVIWKMHFQSEVCSSSRFPTEAMVWINEIDSAENMDELKLSSSILGRNIPNFEVTD